MLILVIAGLCVFAYLACNLGANNRRIGHSGYGWAPALYALIACVLALLLWTWIDPLATGLLGPILAHVK